MWSPGVRSLLAAVLVAGSACSFVAVRRQPPSPVPPGAPLECTQSRAAPVLDTAGAIATPIVGVAVWGLCAYLDAMQSWSSDPSHLKCGGVLWATLAGTAAYTGSAVYGFHHTGECRRLAELQVGPAPPPPPMPPPGAR